MKFLCIFAEKEDDIAQQEVLQLHFNGLFAFLCILSPLNRICELNCEDSCCSGVSQYELLLQLITAVNGTAEPSIFHVQACILGWMLTL